MEGERELAARETFLLHKEWNRDTQACKVVRFVRFVWIRTNFVRLVRYVRIRTKLATGIIRINRTYLDS